MSKQAPQVDPVASEAMRTRAMIRSQLTENTGTALCDSGGIYGRHWERNQGRNFESEPRIGLDIRTWETDSGPGLELDLTISAFWAMADSLEYCPELDREFHRFAKRPEHIAEPWTEKVRAWFEDVGARSPFDAEGDDGPITVNTYNDSCLLDQTLQFSAFALERDGAWEVYFIVQTHNGCDARGGYSMPRVYRAGSKSWDWDATLTRLCGREARIVADPPADDPRQAKLFDTGPAERLSWYTDDAGGHWYSDDTDVRLDELYVIDPDVPDQDRDWRYGLTIRDGIIYYQGRRLRADV